MKNSRGTYKTTYQLSMRAFDKCPPTIRQALAHADYSYATQPFLTAWRRGVRVSELVKDIRQSDRRRAAQGITT